MDWFLYCVKECQSQKFICIARTHTIQFVLLNVLAKRMRFCYCSFTMRVVIIPAYEWEFQPELHKTTCQFFSSIGTQIVCNWDQLCLFETELWPTTVCLAKKLRARKNFKQPMSAKQNFGHFISKTVLTQTKCRHFSIKSQFENNNAHARSIRAQTIHEKLPYKFCISLHSNRLHICLLTFMGKLECHHK